MVGLWGAGRGGEVGGIFLVPGGEPLRSRLGKERTGCLRAWRWAVACAPAPMRGRLYSPLFRDRKLKLSSARVSEVLQLVSSCWEAFCSGLSPLS